MKNFIAVILCITGCICYGQTGVIRGKVIDIQSETPLSGATVEVIDMPNGTATTDESGNFKIENVPLGRQSVLVTFLGYEAFFVGDIAVTTGKDVQLSITMNESFDELQEVVITAERDKVKALNKMATVSARQFSLEEVNRYAGGRSDVARLAANFAGVSTADDSRNDIVVRGNSPTGMLWRIEGIPVPSPNHFATFGTTGSPVSALNPNLLANSDFLTSAFPAEYGNAISGVFDLNFRKGNNEDYEFMASIGAFPGLEFMAEGPLGKKGGSFIGAARYGVAGFVGAGGTSAQPNYRDVSFNIDFGNFSFGNLTLFGIGGTSDIEFLGKDADEDDLFAAEDENADVYSAFGAFGLTHTITINDKSYLRTTAGASVAKSTYEQERLFNYGTPQETPLLFTDVDNTESRITFSTLFNSKISRRFTLRTGLLYENFSLDANLFDRDRQPDNDNDGYPDLTTIYQTDGTYDVIQPYAQGQFRLTEKLTLNGGIHGQYFSVNEEFAIEPRASLTWAISPIHSVNFGYGIHHQNVAAPILFQNANINGELVQTNRDLDLVRSTHYVIGYDVKLAKKWRAKAEVYYQDIAKAAVERFPSSYSSLTEGSDFGFSTDKPSLISEGTGYNTGIEFTLEKFFSDGYHGLMTTSLFESKYEGSDGIERNSPFNNQYVFNLLGGKEFKIGSQKTNVFSIDTKFTTAGGRYYTPVDLASSVAAGYEITDDVRAYSEQYDAYLRLDVKFGMKFNSKTKKQSHQFYIDLQNVTNNKNVFVREYNRLTNRVDQVDQIGFFPDFGYKFQF
ncbi:TonB-dependent receptor [Flavobacterium salilacus subsp. salilacus]|uniref:TonB-dependent receptor n=1 Tax=Flavobacterium TaxID=237 RepID=UPI00107572CC|nr:MULTISPECIES: TonB-dependent receptor [Flavobacterium]KAF2519582.1 TonB-dependent receptor [Flavobacterium salilacus subsp. salilacus]MBE1614516.1 TonB-dependent receptor [Flavobacterium sp. SaA2.13]